MRKKLVLCLALWSAFLAMSVHVPGYQSPTLGMASALLLEPPLLSIEGCSGLPQALAFRLTNNTGAAGTFDLLYLVPAGDATFTGPSHISLDDGQAAEFEAILTPGVCAVPEDPVYARIEASGNGLTATAEISQAVYVDPRWEPVQPHPMAYRNWLVQAAVDPQDGLEYMYVAGSLTLSTFRYDPRDGSWTTLAGVLPDYLTDAGDCAEYDGRIYARTTGLESLSSRLYTYDIGSDLWSSAAVPASVEDRARYDAVELGGQIYFLGGQELSAGTYSNAVDRFDPADGSWASMAPMLHPRALAMAWAYLGKLYVAGGLNAQGILSATEVYDPATDSWTEDPALFATLPAPRHSAGDAVLAGELWVIGGWEFAATDGTLYWTAPDNAWHAGPSLVSAATALESTLLGGQLYAVGGSDGTDLLDTNQRLAICPDRSECQGWLAGRVYDAEIVPPAPACTAPTLSLTPGGDVPVDAITGRYGPLLLSPGFYLLEAGAPGYSLEPAGVAVRDALTTTQDIGLWRPAIATSPQRLQVASLPGSALEARLWITNTGHLPLDFQLLELAPAVHDGASAPGGELPWLWASPSAGELGPQEATTVELTLLCTTAEEGQVLIGTLATLHTDPCAAPAEIGLEFVCGQPTRTVYLPLLQLGDGPLLERGRGCAQTETVLPIR